MACELKIIMNDFRLFMHVPKKLDAKSLHKEKNRHKTLPGKLVSEGDRDISL